jgi:hypothetical protein
MKFTLRGARATRDFDFLLDVVHLREQDGGIKQILDSLGYQVAPESRNFQFEKAIPNSQEIMRIEFMAPHELKRKKDFRVEISRGLHARECFGGSIALHECDSYELTGLLPDGRPAAATLRVTRPTALVLLKLLALDDRYRNIRGPADAEHDREEAQTHAADIIAIMTASLDKDTFRRTFLNQLQVQPEVEARITSILLEYFRTDTAPGMLLYEEALRRSAPANSKTRVQLHDELNRAFRMITRLFALGGQPSSKE